MPTLETPHLNQPSQELPGGALPEWNLFKETEGGKGFVTPEGERYQLGEGESLVFVSTNNGREPYIQTDKDPEGRIPFEAWGPRNVSKNIEHLKESGEVGAYLVDLYAAALAQDPRLEAVVINPSSGKERHSLRETGGFATHKDKSTTGKHEVTMNTGDGWQHYEGLLRSRRASVEVFAEKLGIEPSQLNARLLAGFIFIHEMGHVASYMDDQRDFSVQRTRQSQELGSLPFPMWAPSRLEKWLETEEGQQYWETHAQGWKEQGLDSPAALVERQEKAYRNLETEDSCDQFAVKVFQKSGLIDKVHWQSVKGSL